MSRLFSRARSPLDGPGHKHERTLVLPIEAIQPAVVMPAGEVRHVVGKVALTHHDVKPWPTYEKKRLHLEARTLYYKHEHDDPDMFEVPDEQILGCMACRLHGKFGTPPAFEGWERIMVQANQIIRLRYINRVLRGDEEYTEEYRQGLERDVFTFGLVLTAW